MAPRIVADPEQITPEWLTAALASSGRDGRVESFASTRIGTGQVGDNVRFVLTGSNVPDSVVGKFPATDPVSRQTGIAQGNYLREVHFYRHIRPTVDVQTPAVFFADVDPETHEFVLLMEDLAPGVQGDQLAGCGVDDAALALEQLARLQGPRWGDTSLLNHPLFNGGYTRATVEPLRNFYAMVRPGFLARYDGRLDAREVGVVERVEQKLANYHDAWVGPLSFIHIDYRLDNMMFGGPYPLAVVDWQSISIGCPLLDASYFMGTSLEPGIRGQEEARLLRHYLDILRGYDVHVDYDDAFAAYRNYAPAGLVMAVIASMIVGETERGNDMFMAMAMRSIRMCEELDTFAI